MLAERIEDEAILARAPFQHERLMAIAAEVRELEARELARLSARAYSTSPSGYGDLVPGESRVTYESRPHTPTISQPPHDGSYWHEPPYIAEPECEEPR